ncbi:hypothetical protein JXA40_09845 [bacterium]|nr:hypothetical protein [candidate division CSSED10-310 bacterium]
MMETIRDFEDLLMLFARQDVRYLIIGGLAFIYHAKPRYTKDMDLWIDPQEENVIRANHALTEFGSLFLLDHTRRTEITQLGIAPNRIDLLLEVEPLIFDIAWQRRIVGRYGESPANWIDIDSLITIKQNIDKPKHREDARILMMVKEMNRKKKA